MSRKNVMYLALAALSALGVAACGDDSSGDDPPATPPVETVAPVDTTAPPATVPSGIEHPIVADDVVVRIGYEGGFAPVEMMFLNLPTLLVSGDGHAYVQGPVPEIYPGPLLPNVQVSSVTEAGIQDLLQLADEHGLLAPVTYPSSPSEVADASDTVVEISANASHYEHRAYALGIVDETDPARQALADFVAAAADDWLYGPNPEIGPQEPYASDTFLIRAIALTDISTDIPPTFVDWPVDSSIRLAEASDCAEMPASEVGDLFASANQLTYFTENGVTYSLLVKPQLPGDTCETT